MALNPARRSARAAAFVACVGLLPSAALAHAGERGLVLLMPTGHYIAGGVLVVAASFLALALTPTAPLRRAWSARLVWRRPALGLGPAASWGAFLIFAALLASGPWGATDPLENPLPLTVWTLWWVGFTLATALFGDLWRWLAPWAGPARLLRRAVGPAPFTLPAWLGCWPAMLGFGVFAWFELVSLAPADPPSLARAAGLYWLIALAGWALFGEEDWRRRGECFSVFFGFVALLAPIWTRRAGGRVEQILAPPGARLLAAPAPSASGALFILLALATVSFDGLSKTFWWLALIGVNPLEFPGRSAVTVANTLGLLAAWAALSAAFALAVVGGRRLCGARGPATESFGRLALTLLPIALAYHFAHYLPAALVDGQYALAAADDPLGVGADLLGLGHVRVTTSFFHDAEAVALIWFTQAAAIVAGHVAAVLAAHLIAVDLDGAGRRAVLGQLPLAALMALYTLLGLWLLATPTGA